MEMNKNYAGLETENLASTYLINHGLKLAAQNYHCKYGEIDLIMKDAKTLVFTEVRIICNSQFGSTGTSITPKKQQKLILVSQNYLQQHRDGLRRFDSILKNKTDTNHIEWVHNAFDT